MDDNSLLFYSKHILLPQIDYAGQVKLSQAKVAIIGAGGLGCAAAMYLAVSGVGQLHLIDHDVVEQSNLSRQILYTNEDLGKSKVIAARNKLLTHNYNIEVIAHADKLTKDNAGSFLNHSAVDLILDCSDNFATRYLVNQTSVDLKQTLVSAAAIGFTGQLAGFSPFLKKGCYQCLFPRVAKDEATLGCREQGVASPLVGMIGAMQALETIKIILNFPDTILGKFFYYDGLPTKSRIISLRADDSCIICR